MDLGFKGGFSFLGKQYKSHPFEIIWANEINAAACRTYRKNIDPNIVEGDINACLEKIPAYADVVIGGFPCQDISINGKMAGVDGARSGLYRCMVEVVRRTCPKVFVAENVKGLLMKRNESFAQARRRRFFRVGVRRFVSTLQCRRLRRSANERTRDYRWNASGRSRVYAARALR
ncbi:MAG: DNA cytosine methyltransferase [Thermoguttaceae bacterium]|nr:DNA cytosine methyltransferase [Thermoguttaceae bacterium]